MDAPFFNHIHAKAFYKSLATFHRRYPLHPSLAESLAVPKLQSYVEAELVKQDAFEPEDFANVFMSMGFLQDAGGSFSDLVSFLLQACPAQAPGMSATDLTKSLWVMAKLKSQPELPAAVRAVIAEVPREASRMSPQALSKCLWAAVQLKRKVPDVLELVPTLVPLIGRSVLEMTPQDLSNNLFIAESLKDEIPEVLTYVPTLVAEVPSMAHNMKPRHLSNCLTSFLVLQEEVPEVKRFLELEDGKEDFVSFAALRFRQLLPELKGKDLYFAMPGCAYDVLNK